MPDQPLQTSETFRLSALLAFSGGFLDAYTFNLRDHVFANAQTGNLVLLSQHIMLGEWSTALRYFLPVLTFVFGIILVEQIHYRYKMSRRLHWRQAIVALEAIILFVVGFFPFSMNNAANMLVSFCCAMQFQAFRKIHGYTYASTMVTGNLRSATDSLSNYLHSHQRSALLKAYHYYGIILIFAIGAGFGSVFSRSLGYGAIWIACALLLVACIMMFKDHLKKHGTLY